MMSEISHPFIQSELDYRRDRLRAAGTVVRRRRPRGAFRRTKDRTDTNR